MARYLRNLELNAERFSEVELRRSKTPDFRIIRDEAVVGFCEVKSPNDPWLEDILRTAPAGVIVGGPRPDPIYNRLARHLNTADQQFAAVNASRDKLAFVNHDHQSDVGDLRAILGATFKQKPAGFTMVRCFDFQTRQLDHQNEI